MLSNPRRGFGVACMIGAGLCWSLGGLIVRAFETSDTWLIVFWRSVFMALFVAVLLLLRAPQSALARVRGVGRAGVAAAACLAVQIWFFILALTLTSTANTFVLMSVAPLMTAVVGRVALGERVAPLTWAAIAVALAGIVIMFGADFGTGAGGHWLGNLLALGIPFAYAVQIVFVRRITGPTAAPPDLMPVILIGGIFAATPAAFLAGSLAVGGTDLALLALMGCVQLGLGCYLMTLAVPHLRAAEIGLLSLIEPILAPVWVWLGVGEEPGIAALTGGALILGAMFVNGYLTLKRETAPRQSATSSRAG
ncbi:MAG: DMT family transporter [Burkholderiales bacterium]|nr:DMT family transporter [Burkholderiales bacterium]